MDELRGEQVHALLAQLVLQTDRLRDLADQLLDLSQIESGGAAGPPERFDPRKRLEGLVPGSRATAPATCTCWSSPAARLSPTRSRSSAWPRT